MKIIILAGLFGAVGLPSIAAADTYLDTTCSTSVLNGNETYCDQGVSFNLESDGTSTIYSLRLTAPAAHCSPVMYAVAFPPPPPPPPDSAYALPKVPLDPILAGTNSIGRTTVLAPGQSDFADLGRGFGRGRHELMIMVIGLVQDCNVGQLQSWGVYVEPLIVPE